MAENKTTRNEASVAGFLDSIEDERKRVDSQWLCDMMGEATGDDPAMWGEAIVGFGQRRLVYESGRELDWFTVGFSPRKRNLTLYIMDGFDRYDELLGSLGNHSTGKSCLYVNRLDDIDRTVLTELVEESVAHLSP